MVHIPLRNLIKSPPTNFDRHRIIPILASLPSRGHYLSESTQDLLILVVSVAMQRSRILNVDHSRAIIPTVYNHSLKIVQFSGEMQSPLIPNILQKYHNQRGDPHTTSGKVLYRSEVEMVSRDDPLAEYIFRSFDFDLACRRVFQPRPGDRLTNHFASSALFICMADSIQISNIAYLSHSTFPRSATTCVCHAAFTISGYGGRKPWGPGFRLRHIVPSAVSNNH